MSKVNLKELKVRCEMQIQGTPNSDILAEDILPLILALEVGIGALRETVTSCTHDDTDENYRPLGETYGWCDICQEKVHRGVNFQLEALTIIQNLVEL